MGKKKHNAVVNNKKTNGVGKQLDVNKASGDDDHHDHHQQQQQQEHQQQQLSQSSLNLSISTISPDPMEIVEEMDITDPTIGKILNYKSVGNGYFGKKKYKESLATYSNALKLIEDHTSTIPTVLLTQMLSNRAMVLLKLLRYDESENDCNRILDTMKIHDQPKVWYRRAVSREGKAILLLVQKQPKPEHNEKEKQEMARHYLLQAKRDLQECLKASPGDDNALKMTVATMAARLQKLLSQTTTTATTKPIATNTLARTGATTPSSSMSNKENTNSASKNLTSNTVETINKTSTPSKNAVTPSTIGSERSNEMDHDQISHNLLPTALFANNRPTPEQQRIDIRQLLIARKVSIAKYYQQLQSHPQQQEALESIVGEGFFLLDWNWWCRWTQHTHFFELSNTNGDNGTTNNNNNNNNGKTSKQQQLLLLRYFPSGATLPYDDTIIPSSIKKTHNDDDSSTSDDDDDDDNVKNHCKRKNSAPGPIDNSKLLLPPLQSPIKEMNALDIFYSQWYGQYLSNARNVSDNSDDCHNQVPIRPNLVRGYHYELLPREVYYALRTWYGEITMPICRRSMIFDHGILQVQLYSSLFQSEEESSIDPKNGNSTNNNQKSQDILSKDNSTYLCNSCLSPNATMRCRRCLAVRYCNRGCQESHWIAHKTICKEIANNADPTGLNSKTSNVESPSRDYMIIQNSIDNTNYSYVLAGRVGLNNLGNTCFMNSALQCLSHATPLTRHFLSGSFKNDINPSNLLGTGGKLATAYATVLKDLWWMNQYQNGNNTNTNQSISPTSLKRAIALFAPRFSGYLQHDTQEFLAYLLDGLHEDLNRIVKAPYVEMPDVSTSTNQSIAAALCWDSHKRRNDSIVLDTFYGQFKSTCVCPQCNKVSVSFDAFNHVSLEIPQLIKPKTEVVPFPVLVFRSPIGDEKHPPIPIRYGVPYHYSRNYGITEFRKELSALCQIPASQLELCEVYRHGIVNIYQDNNRKPLTDVIRMNDFVVAYEKNMTNNNDKLYHVVCKHYFVDPIAAKQTGRAPQDRNPQPEIFGIPFLSSFPGNYTCKQVWYHIWNIVANLVNKLESTPNFDDRTLLTIRVVDSYGNAREVFSRPKLVRSGSMDSTGSASSSRRQFDMTSILPSYMDDAINECLGDEEDAVLFFALEWTDPSDDEVIDEVDAVDPTKIIEHRINEERFSAYENHSSWLDAMEKIKETNNTNNKKSKLVDRVTLQQCFDTFTKPERLDEHNMWYCSNCKDHVRAMKTMQLWKLPNILIVHLKRFEFKQHHGFRRDKLDTLVDFPLEGLDLNQHCSTTYSSSSSSSPDCFINDHIPAIYDCFAVTNHFGSMGFGHYTAFARKWNELNVNEISSSSLCSNWVLFDDASVRNIANDKAKDVVVSQAAYVLFYRRRIFN